MNRLWITIALLAVASLSVALTCANAQNSAGGCWAQRAPSAEAPATLDHILRDAGYASTRASLTAALGDPSVDLRSVAAARLATSEGISAIPVILAAMAGEENHCAHLGMRLALASLGKPVYALTLAHRGGQTLAAPFQPCTPSEPPTLSLSIEPVPRAPGTGPLIRTRLRNLTQEPLALLQLELAGPTFPVTVLDPAGSHAAIAKEREWLYGPGMASLTLAFIPPALVPLLPNEEISSMWKVGEDFDMSAPGVYRVSLGGPLDYLNTTVCSNTIDVTVDK